MRFATKQDIEAPIADVFRIMADFEAWERSIMRRGTEVSRMDKLQTTGAGMRWASRFTFRGKAHDVEAELTQYEPHSLMRFAGVSKSMEGIGSIELMELSAKRTRMHVAFELTPRTMTARIFMQSLRLARAKMDRGFALRVANFAGDIENRYRTAKKA